MDARRISIGFFVCLFLSLGCNDIPLGHEREHEFSEIEDCFMEPDGMYRPVPFWVWNTRVTREDIDRMLEDFKEQGYGGGFVHPRPGMETPYLSEEWFDLWEYSLRKAEELGLKLWIYDENSYPSGFAGGHVQTEFPESYDHPSELKPVIVDRLPEDMSPYCLCLRQEGDTFVDITSQPRTDEEGRYFLYKEIYPEKQRWLGGFAYVDLLYPGTTEKFIEVTMRGYEERFGADLASSANGVFTDEPHWHRWTPGMFEEFEKDWGYDLRTHLPMLKEEIGNWKQVRYQFMSTKLRLFIERWSMPWYEYCEEKGLLWTGHYWEHEWPNMKRSADNMAMYQWHQVPGIDLLFNRFDYVSPHAHWGNVRAVKELRSAANQVGQTRTLCESYGGGGWDMTFKDFKRLADWQYALGVNFMCQHFANVTNVGVRKFDYPPFFTSYAPWSSDYKVLNDHVARLSLVLSHGEQVNDILVIEPNSTIWSYYTHRYEHPMVETIAGNFQALVTSLNKAQVEFDLGSETIIRNLGKVRDGKFIVGRRAYTTVIIPEMCETLFASTAELLKKFVAEGGHLVALSSPTAVDGTEDSAMSEIFAGESVQTTLDMASLNNGKILFEDVAGGDLQHHRREFKDGTLLFLANSSLSENACGVVTVEGAGFKYLDTFTGKICREPAAVAQGGKVSLRYDLPPAGHLLLFAPLSSDDSDRLQDKETVAVSELTEVPPMSDISVRRIGDNYLSMEFCDLIVDGAESCDIFVGEACQKLFAHFGMQNPWERRVQFKDNIISADTLGTGDITVRYRFNVDGQFDYSDMKFVCERPSLWEVRINGETVSPIEGEHPLDARTGSYAIGEYVHEGENIVTLHRTPMSIYAEVSFAFITGDFAVIPDKVGWKISAPQELALGSWKVQGLPFFSWDVGYARQYDLSAGAKTFLCLEDWYGTVAQVWVNGSKAGILFSKPYELDITDHVINGVNEIEVRCTGSLYNLYGPHFYHKRGKVGPNYWYSNAVPSHADDYSLLDYGLMSPFDVKVVGPNLHLK